MKFGQILACCMTNIFDMFLGEYLRLKTSPRPLYDFIKMTIYRDLAIFNSCRLPFWIFPYSPFQKNETLESLHNWLWSNWGRLLNWKEPGTYPQSVKLFERFLKIIALDYIYQLAKFGDLMSCCPKDIFKNTPCFIY